MEIDKKKAFYSGVKFFGCWFGLIKVILILTTNMIEIFNLL